MILSEISHTSGSIRYIPASDMDGVALNRLLEEGLPTNSLRIGRGSSSPIRKAVDRLNSWIVKAHYLTLTTEPSYETGVRDNKAQFYVFTDSVGVQFYLKHYARSNAIGSYFVRSRQLEDDEDNELMPYQVIDAMYAAAAVNRLVDALEKMV